MKTARYSKPFVIGVGELLWDLLPAGKQLGGAPSNFAYHAHAFGAEAFVVSRIGNDALGREIRSQLLDLGLRTDGITIDPLLPTGTVGVTLDARGKPAFTIHENVAWDFIEAGKDILAEASQADAICFGSLAQRNPASRAAIRAMLAVAPPTALRIFDINLRQHFWSRELILESLELAHVLKLNDEELPVVAKLLDLAGDEANQMRQLAARFELEAVALTKGASGSSLLLGHELISPPRVQAHHCRHRRRGRQLHRRAGTRPVGQAGARQDRRKCPQGGGLCLHSAGGDAADATAFVERSQPIPTGGDRPNISGSEFGMTLGHQTEREPQPQCGENGICNQLKTIGLQLIVLPFLG